MQDFADAVVRDAERNAVPAFTAPDNRKALAAVMPVRIDPSCPRAAAVLEVKCLGFRGAVIGVNNVRVLCCLGRCRGGSKDT